MIVRCALCNNAINDGAIITVGPCKDDPETKFYHVGCKRQQLEQLIASTPPGESLTVEAGERT